MTRNHWLMKSEPDVYPWSKLVADERGSWDGVRNHQAANNLRAMRKGDHAFFYHSNIGKEIVGTMEIVREAYPDASDTTGKWVMVDVVPLKATPKTVTLAAMRDEPKLAKLAILRHTRLSVSPVEDAEWKLICRLAGLS
jgi:predicted RNA-binding protein with PUA-like domain